MYCFVYGAQDHHDSAGMRNVAMRGRTILLITSGYLMPIL